MLLAADAEVRLVYASRNKRQILYNHDLWDLLSTYSSRFGVLHCLSRPESDSELLATTSSTTTTYDQNQDGDGKEDGVCDAAADQASCVSKGVERFRRGRVSPSVLLDEFGDWSGPSSAIGSGSAEPYYMVVGSKQQERDAWRWLREGGLGTRSLLTGGRWMPLVR